jgi:sec-independent protein translocase protein TatA
MPNVGIPEIIIVAFILLLLFGAKRIPEIMRSLGVGMREFKEGVTDTSPVELEEKKVAPPTSAPTTPAASETTTADPVGPTNH